MGEANLEGADLQLVKLHRAQLRMEEVAGDRARSEASLGNVEYLQTD